MTRSLLSHALFNGGFDIRLIVHLYGLQFLHSVVVTRAGRLRVLKCCWFVCLFVCLFVFSSTVNLSLVRGLILLIFLIFRIRSRDNKERVMRPCASFPLVRFRHNPLQWRIRLSAQFVFNRMRNTKPWNHLSMCAVVLWTKIVVEFL